MSCKRPESGGSYVAKSESACLFTDVPTQLSVEDNYVEVVKVTNLSPLDYRAPLEFTVSCSCCVAH